VGRGHWAIGKEQRLRTAAHMIHSDHGTRAQAERGSRSLGHRLGATAPDRHTHDPLRPLRLGLGRARVAVTGPSARSISSGLPHTQRLGIAIWLAAPGQCSLERITCCYGGITSSGLALPSEGAAGRVLKSRLCRRRGGPPFEGSRRLTVQALTLSQGPANW
jgi:hypothetical protein